jgi:hypothetical protein
VARQKIIAVLGEKNFIVLCCNSGEFYLQPSLEFNWRLFTNSFMVATLSLSIAFVKWVYRAVVVGLE